MVNPVTGPTTRRSLSTGRYPGTGYSEQSLYKQARPYNLALPYGMYRAYCVSGDTPTDSVNPLSTWYHTVTVPMSRQRATLSVFNPLWTDIFGDDLGAVWDGALNRARAKFMSEANSEVSLAVDLLQGRQAIDMIANRLTQLGRAARHARRLDAKGFLRECGWSRPPHRPRKPLRDAGSVWLEYSYGWKPLVGDIYDAGKVFETPYGTRRIKKSVTEPFNRTYVYDWSDEKESNDVSVTCTAQVGGEVTLSNPNLQVLKNSGLTNPLEWAWELIPFSFVVDWFVNVGDFIGALDDTVGLSISNGYYSRTWKGTSTLTCVANYGDFKGQRAFKQYLIACMYRDLGTPPVKLMREKKVLTNLPRALNAASLLTQLLKK